MPRHARIGVHRPCPALSAPDRAPGSPPQGARGRPQARLGAHPLPVSARLPAPRAVLRPAGELPAAAPSRCARPAGPEPAYPPAPLSSRRPRKRAGPPVFTPTHKFGVRKIGGRWEPSSRSGPLTPAQKKWGRESCEGGETERASAEDPRLPGQDSGGCGNPGDGTRQPVINLPASTIHSLIPHYGGGYVVGYATAASVNACRDRPPGQPRPPGRSRDRRNFIDGARVKRGLPSIGSRIAYLATPCFRRHCTACPANFLCRAIG